MLGLGFGGFFLLLFVYFLVGCFFGGGGGLVWFSIIGSDTHIQVHWDYCQKTVPISLEHLHRGHRTVYAIVARTSHWLSFS